MHNLGNLTVKYCQTWTQWLPAQKIKDLETLDATLIEENTKFRETLESFLIEYFFSLTDVDYENLDYQRKTKVELEASSAVFTASYTEPDVTHMMKPPTNFSLEDSTNLSYGYMVLQMFMERFPFKIEIDDYKINEELEGYRNF